MDHFAGLDVSVKETSVCIVDDTGRIVQEAKVPSDPAALLQVLRSGNYRFKRIGLEAGPLHADWRWLCTASGSMARSSGGRGKAPRHDNGLIG